MKIKKLQTQLCRHTNIKRQEKLDIRTGNQEVMLKMFSFTNTSSHCCQSNKFKHQEKAIISQNEKYQFFTQRSLSNNLFKVIWLHNNI